MRTLRNVAGVMILAALAGCRSNGMPDVVDAGTQQDTNTADRVDTGNQDVMRPDVPVPDGGDLDAGMEAGPLNVTIRDLQDPDAAMHPPPSTATTPTYVTLSQTGMVALSPRLLIRDPDGPDAGANRRCFMGVWVGDGTRGPYSGVQVQELVRQRDAGNCFEAEFRIPKNIQPGDNVLGILNSQYSEFCSSSGMSVPCPGLDQTQLFGPDSFPTTPGTMAPVPADVTVAQVGGTNGAPGPETVAREGTLVRLTNVLTARGMDGTFTLYEVVDSSAPTGPRLTVDISNITSASTLRGCWDNQLNVPVTVTGILFPSFSRWRLKVRTVSDVTGLNCPIGGSDAGVTDSGTSDSGSGDGGGG